jgi:hypothetical protein
MRYQFEFIVLTAVLAGCGGPIRDTDPRVSGLIHQCFSTVKESIFISGRCQAIDGWPYCDTVKPLNPDKPRLAGVAQLPPTLQAYREDSAYWSAQIHAEQSDTFRKPGDHLIVYGGLPIGTSLEIVRVSRWSNGENGTFWIAYANIRNGEFKGREILLPWHGFDSSGWIYSPYVEKVDHDPDVDTRFLAKCEAKAAAPVESP